MTDQNTLFDKKNVENIFPLAPMQQGLLFHSLLAPNSGAYVPQVVLTLRGNIQPEKMADAWQIAVNRHGVLRSGFYWEKRDEPYQIQFRQLPIHWVEQDWSQLTGNEQQERLNTLLECNRSEPFTLNRPPLMRLFWIKVAANRVKMIWCYHHLILDGWSASLVLKEVLHQYSLALENNTQTASAQSASTHLPAPPPYSEFLKWLKKNEPLKQQALNHWQEQLQDFPALPHLPGQANVDAIPRANHPVKNDKPQRLEPGYTQLQLAFEETQAIHSYLQTQKLTLNTLLQGALALTLRRYGNNEDIVFGTTVSGRPSSLDQSTSMVGLFINTLPVRISMPNGNNQLGTKEWLSQIQVQQQAASEFEQVSLREIQSQCNAGESLFNCLLVVESYPIETSPNANDNGQIHLDKIEFDENTHLPLTIQAAPGKQLTLAARIDKNRIDLTTATRFLTHFKNAILSLSNVENQSIQAITLLSDEEKAQREQWNQTHHDWQSHQSLADLFEAQVDSSPDQIALLFDGNSLSYRQLNQQANQLAVQLNQKTVGPDAIVAVYMERSFELLIALIAIQKVGAAWLPLDPAQPNQRLLAMVEDAKPALIITNHSNTAESDLAAHAQRGELRLSNLNEMGCAIDAEIKNPARNPQLHNENSAAYLIYTSGSTGKPKGVINTQKGIVNRLLWMQSTYNLTQQDRVLQKTPISFDVSVWELFWPLITGATLVIAKPGGHLDREYLAHCIAQNNISVTHFVPGMLADFLDADSTTKQPNTLQSLRDVICSGEALTAALQQKFFDILPNTLLHNLYGPTEAAIDVTAWQCDATHTGQRIPIGKPIFNTQIHLLDADGHEVPVGAKGHLHIGGVGVARGYLNRPKLNKERFVANPFSTQESNTLYATGDSAIYREDGNIEYLGRLDDQIKLRGVRIELGEIEAALAGLEGIKQAAARLVSITHSNQPTQALVAYLVLENSSQKPTPEFLQQSLKNQLPAAMIPSDWVFLESMPITANGKPNRKALPIPASNAQHQASFKPPVTEQEKLLAAIWQECLGLAEPPSIESSFFQLGGHSLIATRIVNRVRQATQLELPLASIFDYPTLQALAQHLEQLQTEQQQATQTQNTQQSNNQYREVTL